MWSVLKLSTDTATCVVHNKNLGNHDRVYTSNWNQEISGKVRINIINPNYTNVLLAGRHLVILDLNIDYIV